MPDMSAMINLIKVNPTLISEIGDCPNIEFPTVGGKVFWKDIKTYNGWRLQHNYITGYTRILDDHDIRKAWGSQSVMEEKFKRLTRRDFLEPGDIVLYGTSAYNITHAAIYVGDGLIINALNPSYGVYYNYVNHAAVYQYPGHNTFALSEPALFGIRPYGRIANMGTKVDLGHSFTAEIVDVSTSRLVTASSSSVILAKKSEARGTTQKWLFTRTTDNSYHIQCVSNNRALDVTGGYLKEGTAIKNVKLNTSLKRQKFYVQRLSDGTYVLRPMISQEKVFSFVDKKGVLSSYTKKSGQRFKIVKKDQISVEYTANGGTGSVGTTLMNFGKTLTLKSKGNIQRPGYEFRGWFAYREADKKYYCGSTHKWQTSAAIEKYGYKRTVFKAGAKYPIGYSWVNTKNGLQTLVMKAAWKKL
jgi:hypothetical protein